jgi:undecaprenyl-diphosphatase
MEMIIEIITKIDTFLLSGFHALAEKSGDFLTPFSKFLTAIGEKGLIFLVLAVVLMLFPKTRKLGVCLFGSIACCYLISNMILKELFERTRPYLSTVEIFQWWAAAGHVQETGFSCPSGHVGAAMAGVSAIWFFRNRDSKYDKLWLFLFLWPMMMIFARCYLMAHYPTDCLLGLLVGWISAFLAWYVTEFIWVLLENHKNAAFPFFVLNANLINLVKRYIAIARKRKSAAQPDEAEGTGPAA